MELPKTIVVAAGGIAGSAVRWAVLDITGRAVWALLAVNTTGALLLGAVVHGLLNGGHQSRLLVGVGFCGALTTFSTLALEVAARLDDGRVGDAVSVAGASLVLGLAAALTGASTRQWATR